MNSRIFSSHFSIAPNGGAGAGEHAVEAFPGHVRLDGTLGIGLGFQRGVHPTSGASKHEKTPGIEHCCTP